MLKFFVLSLLAFSALAQSDKPAGRQTATLGMANGRVWAAMDIPFEKVCYLTGIKDALIALDPPNANDYQIPEISAGEIAKSIDAFYAVPENVRIPITWAVRISVAKLKGASARDLETMTEAFRKVAAIP